MSIPRDQIDPDAQKVIKRLVRNNHQAYLVGGCVRDLLLGRTPKDFDVATSATPPEIKELFRNCRIIGRRFRLAHIFFGGKIIETSTFRSNPREAELDENGAEDLDRDADDLLIRRDNVFGTAEEDARRRDFTMNGLFYDLEADNVIDYVGGLADLEARMVRTIGDPEIRFREDPVRILRAIKFAARLGFEIEPGAWQAIRDHKHEIPKCAPPRILEEIYRLLRGGAAHRSMELLLETGVLDVLVPELAARLRDPAHADANGRLWTLLDRLDGGEAAPSNAVLLCALAGPYLGRGIVADEGPGAESPDVLFDERARPMLDHMRVSRRDGERARQILLMLRRLAPAKRRRRPMAIVRRDIFEEALEVFGWLAGAAFDDDTVRDEIARWRRLQKESHPRPEPGEGAVPPVEGAAPPANADEAGEPRRRRRRRRGGRRHRRGGGGGDGTPPLPDGGSVAAASSE